MVAVPPAPTIEPEKRSAYMCNNGFMTPPIMVQAV